MAALEEKTCDQCGVTTPADAPHLNHLPGCKALLDELAQEAQDLGFYDTPEELQKRFPKKDALP